MSQKKETKEKKEKKKYKLGDEGDEDEDLKGREIKMTFTKKSKKINRPVTFNDDPTEINVTIETEENNGEMFVLKAPLHKVTQKSPIMSKNDCNSETNIRRFLWVCLWTCWHAC